jgi:serine/threonine-protein kinase Nek2
LKKKDTFIRTSGGAITEIAVGDFDTAKQLSSKIKARTVLGTPAYMAPEVLDARKLGVYTFAADVFSIGMLIYELLALKPPFEELPPFKVADAIVSGQVPVLPPLPSAYQSLVDLHVLCIRPNPQERPSLSAIIAAMKSK